MSTLKHVPEDHGADRNDRRCSACTGDVVHDVQRRGRLVVLVVSLLSAFHELEDDRRRLKNAMPSKKGIIDTPGTIRTSPR